MAKHGEYKFKLPSIIPITYKSTANTSVQNWEKSISIPKDNIRLTPEVDFLIEQQKKEELNYKLAKKRQFATTMLKNLQIQWKKLEQNELAFQRTIVAHNKFLKRNLEKRERAHFKIQTDMELTRKREREIKVLNQRYEFFDSVLGKMRAQIMQHCIYERYLNSVIDHIDSPFKMIQDFLAKFEALQAVKDYCMKKQSKEMSTTIEMHDNNVEFFRIQDVTLVGMKNEFNNLTSRFDEVVRESSEWDALIGQIMIKCNTMLYETDTTLHMIESLYRYIVQRRNQKIKMKTMNLVERNIAVIKYTMATWESIQAKRYSDLVQKYGLARSFQKKFKRKIKKFSKSSPKIE